MKTYGIVIDEAMVKEELRAEGLENLTGLALKAARAEVTMALALEQSKNAMGDLERTSDTYANVQRKIAAQTENLSMTIGSVFLPLWNKVLQAFSRLLEIIDPGEIAGVLNAVIEGFIVFGEELYELFTGLGTLIKGVFTLSWEDVKEGAKQLYEVLFGEDRQYRERISQAYETGKVAYEEFLQGNLQAFYESKIAEEEIVKESDEVKRMTHEEHLADIQNQIIQHNLKLGKEADKKYKKEQAAASKELRLTQVKERQKQLAQVGTLQSAGAALGSFFGQTKGVAKAQAIIDTYAGMNRALGTGVPPWSFVQAAIIAAQGFANVARISAQSFALGGEITRPTLALAGEAGPEIVAPKKTFIDVTNEMMRRGEIGSGGGNSVLLSEVRGLREAIENQNLVAELDAESLSIVVENGNRALELREF
jgi:hypothetical protein